MKMRKGTKHIKTFPKTERCVAMCQFKGNLYVATEKRIYILVKDKLETIKIVKAKGRRRNIMRKMAKQMTIKDVQEAQDSHEKCQKEIHKILKKYLNEAHKAVWERICEKYI